MKLHIWLGGIAFTVSRGGVTRERIPDLFGFGFCLELGLQEIAAWIGYENRRWS